MIISSFFHRYVAALLRERRSDRREGGRPSDPPQQLPPDVLFRKGQALRIPDEGDRCQLAVRPPFGTIRFIVYATRLPMSQVNLQSTTGGIFKYRASPKAFGRSVPTSSRRARNRARNSARRPGTSGPCHANNGDFVKSPHAALHFLLPFDRLRASSTPCHGELVEPRAPCLWSFLRRRP